MKHCSKLQGTAMNKREMVLPFGAFILVRKIPSQYINKYANNNAMCSTRKGEPELQANLSEKVTFQRPW